MPAKRLLEIIEEIERRDSVEYAVPNEVEDILSRAELRQICRELLGSRLDVKVTMRKPSSHVRGGNCWAFNAKTDVCMLHDEPRGECDGCPRCPKCDAKTGE